MNNDHPIIKQLRIEFSDVVFGESYNGKSALPDLESFLLEVDKQAREEVLGRLKSFQDQVELYDRNKDAIDDDNGMLYDLILDCKQLLSDLQHQERKGEK